MQSNTETGTIVVRLFGAFRQFEAADAIDVALPAGATVADIRAGLAQHYAGNENALALLRASAFATDEAVLDDADPAPRDRTVSVLPPVCGG